MNGIRLAEVCAPPGAVCCQTCGRPSSVRCTAMDIMSVLVSKASRFIVLFSIMVIKLASSPRITYVSSYYFDSYWRYHPHAEQYADGHQRQPGGQVPVQRFAQEQYRAQGRQAGHQR